MSTPLPLDLASAVREARRRARRLSQEADESEHVWDLELKVDPSAIAWCYGQEELASVRTRQPRAEENSTQAQDQAIAPPLQIPAGEAHPIRGHDAEGTVLVITGDEPLSITVQGSIIDDKVTAISHTFLPKVTQLVDEIRWRTFVSEITALSKLGKFKGAIIIHSFSTSTNAFRSPSSPYGIKELTPSQKTMVRTETAAALRLHWILEF